MITMSSPSIERALTIEGWMSEAELRWLAEQASRHRCIVEIGSYLGRSTRALADNASGVVYAIDDWYGPRDVDWLTPEQRATVLQRFAENMQGTDIKAINSDHAVAEVPETPDFVFIDGDHSYASVLRDIRKWLPRIAPGGLISGHDICRDEVARAVREVFGSYSVAPETTIWYVEV